MCKTMLTNLQSFCKRVIHLNTSVKTLSTRHQHWKPMEDQIVCNLDPKQVQLLNEECIVVDENDKPLGSKSKKECHLMSNIDNGLIHRAFSVMLFNSRGEFLVTQRSDAKITFPTYFTNTCCSHPLYNDLERDEMDAIGVKRAAQRRLHIELGIDSLKIPLQDIKYMTRFLYKAPSGGVWGEYEIDYALVIQKDVQLNPDPNEVKFYKYLPKDQLLSFLENEEQKGNLVTPWFRLMIDNFLFEWWNNLKDLNKYHDHNNIHRLP
ncbi:isopentenyl-diphosphate Delta-isomerase 1-like [Oppia nitens]|uniref:isopentenyl-diphosphate Delta-isomerase 1-like n=1 Tax=Oppia nitens TaxID=1686743 RepID=UPI0023DA892A|nr:isopentenyl-diphosphate Delta-isomerase 1-like [Oppia nitens]